MDALIYIETTTMKLQDEILSSRDNKFWEKCVWIKKINVDNDDRKLNVETQEKGI